MVIHAIWRKQGTSHFLRLIKLASHTLPLDILFTALVKSMWIQMVLFPSDANTSRRNCLNETGFEQDMQICIPDEWRRLKENKEGEHNRCNRVM